MTTEDGPPTPGPHREDWVDFLRYLNEICQEADVVEYVIYCVEKPWKYCEEYEQYLDHGGVDRD